MNTKLRHISYCIMASLLFVACRQESHPITPEEPEEQYAISMSASSTDMTTSRALVSDDDDLQGTDLGVFAYKELADGTRVRVFDNEKVYHKGSVWTYDNTKYWDRAATGYYFVSYSPRLTNDDVEFHEEADQLYIYNIPNWQAIDANAKDYVAAKHQDAVEGGYITLNGVQPVPLDFKHILCQLEVRVVKNPFLVNTYTLSQIDYANVPDTEGTSTYMNTPNGGNMRTSVGDTPITMATLSDVEVGKDATENTTLKHLVVPFTTGTDNFEISLGYAVNGFGRQATVDTQLSQLEENKRYVLTLTFNSGAAVTSKLEILDWEDVDTDEDDKYNW